MNHGWLRQRLHRVKSTLSRGASQGIEWLLAGQAPYSCDVGDSHRL